MVSKSKPTFVLLFVIVLVRSSDEYFVHSDDLESSKCTQVLIREFDSRVNFELAYIKTVSTCPNDYNVNSTIKKKCETSSVQNYTSILEDIFLFTLALDYTYKSKLYFNVYCAICHDVKEFYQFPPYFHYQLINETNANISDSTNIENYYPISGHTSLLANLATNEQTKELVSFSETGLRYKFSPYRVLVVPKRTKKVFKEPMLTHRPPRLPFCFDFPHRNFQCNSNKTKPNDECSFDDGTYSNIFNLQEAIKKLNKEPNRATNATFCPETYIDAGNESSICKYEDDEDGYNCWWNRFLKKGVDYAEGENGEIFFVDDHTMMNITPDEYSVQTGYKDLIYLCGIDRGLEDDENQFYQEVISSIQCLLRRFSIFCIIVYLTMHAHRDIISMMVHKITYSYYTTVLMMYLREEISLAMLDKSCFLKYTVYRYLLQSSAYWIVIATWYLWIIIRAPGAEHALNKNTFKSNMMYLSMCVIGWILPAGVGLLFYVLEPDPPCPKVRGYIHLTLCKTPDEPDTYFWFIFATICTISGIVSVQFLGACYYYVFAKSVKDEDKLTKADWAYRMVFFFKIAYSIVLYMMLLIASRINRKGPMYEVLLHMWSFHGTLIFFMFSFKKTVLKKWLVKRGSFADAGDVNEVKCESKETVFEGKEG